LFVACFESARGLIRPVHRLSRHAVRYKGDLRTSSTAVLDKPISASRWSSSLRSSLHWCRRSKLSAIPASHASGIFQGHLRSGNECEATSRVLVEMGVVLPQDMFHLRIGAKQRLARKLIGRLSMARVISVSHPPFALKHGRRCRQVQLAANRQREGAPSPTRSTLLPLWFRKAGQNGPWSASAALSGSVTKSRSAISRAAPFLLGSFNQPIEQTGVERSLRDALSGPEVKPRLRRQTERACSTVTDEEEAVTAAVPPKATEIEVGLTSLHPGCLARCRLGEGKVTSAWCFPKALLRCQPPLANIRSTRVSKSASRVGGLCAGQSRASRPLG
jgi:hypothetical protein